MTELKPCPFCGQMADHSHDEDAWCGNRGCGAFGRDFERSTWQLRPIEDALRRERDEARAEVERLRAEKGE